MSNPIADVAIPERKPRLGGIKSVIGDFVTAERLAASKNIQWVSPGCSFPELAPGLCWGQDPTGTKTADGIDVMAGLADNFALYAGVECYMPGDDYPSRANKLLQDGEDRAVEAQFAAAFATLTPVAGTGGLAGAIAALDQEADGAYVGRPVIWMARDAAVEARAADLVEGDRDGNLWTANGTPVVASASLSAAEVWVTGWPTVYASGIFVTVVDHPTQNRTLAIAERAYGLAVDCGYTYGITIGA